MSSITVTQIDSIKCDASRSEDLFQLQIIKFRTIVKQNPTERRKNEDVNRIIRHGQAENDRQSNRVERERRQENQHQQTKET